jgi:hypothetical protein
MDPGFRRDDDLFYLLKWTPTLLFSTLCSLCLCGELLTEGGAPGLDLRISSQVASSRDLADAEHERDGLRKAGLPE